MTREQAINEIRSWDFLDEKEIEAIHTLIPELAESEDERIRTELLSSFKGIMADADEDELWYGLPYNDIIAWLEKQKEQKVDIDKLRRDLYQSGYNDGYQHGKEDAQKEQKPIKWTDLTWKDIVELEGIINNVHYEFRNGIGQESFGKEVLERFRESKGDDYVDEQKSAEYLKAERDGWYVCIKDYYRGGKKQSSVGDLVQAKGGMYIMGEEDISEWFRRAYYEEVRDAFEPNADINITEKPAEWSGDDEEMMTDIIESLEYAYPNDNEFRIAWLRSLRPQPRWKPSEEQMEVDLEKEIEKYFKGWTETDEGIACHYQYVDLNTCHGIAHHFYELGQREMRHRITNPEYNAKVVERLKSEYPTIKEDQYEIH